MFKRILKTILNILLFICLIIVCYLAIIRGAFVKDVNAQTKTIDFSNIEEISNYTKEDIHKALDGILKENDIPAGVIDEVLENKEHKEVIDNYLEEVEDSVKNGTTIPSVPKDKIENILKEGINTYNAKYHTNISLTKVKKLVEEFAKKADTLLKLANSGTSLVNHLKKILFNDKLYYGFLIVTFLFILILAIIYKKEAIFSFGGICIFNGIFLLIPYILLKSSNLHEVLALLSMNTIDMQKNFQLSGYIFMGTGIFLLIIYYILMKMHEKKNFKKI